MSDVTKLKEKCTVIERCLPVSDFRVQVAKTHNDLLDRITALEAENKRLEANQPSGITATAKADELLDAYWNAAYKEGLEQRTHDDEEGSSQKASYELLRYINALESERDQARLAAARECLGIIGNGGWYNEDLENAIRQHFGMDDHFADAGKPIEGGEPCA